MFCAEGDNRGDAKALASVVLQLLGTEKEGEFVGEFDSLSRLGLIWC